MAKKSYDVQVISKLCKACGICVSLCPKDVFDRAKDGKAVPARPEDCIGCGSCELHCPDFCVEAKEKEGAE